MAEVFSRLMSLREAATLLGASIYTVRRLIVAGQVKSVRIGARVMISAPEVARLQTEGAGNRTGRATPQSITRAARVRNS